MGDVPLGIFLSGGLDSSAVLAYAANLMPSSIINTYSMGFEDSTYDETNYAEFAASHLGSIHKSYKLTLDRAIELAPKALSNLDAPLSDPSFLPTFALSAHARRDVKVVLSGDGGDELFAGYDPFLALPIASMYCKIFPSKLHEVIRNCAKFIPKTSNYMSLDYKIRRALLGLSYPESIWNPVWMSPIEPNDFYKYFDNPISMEELYEDPISLWKDGERRGLDIIDRTLEFYTEFYFQDNILVKSDSAGMSNGLEIRSVFTDNDLVEFCRRLPNKYKIKNGNRKYLLKKALTSIVSPRIINRKKKGFGIPTNIWVTKIPQKPSINLDYGIKYSALREASNLHQENKVDNRLLLWSWLAMQYSRTFSKLEG
jgi:asparagine synthase (glutamine-hydrolysing)